MFIKFLFESRYFYIFIFVFSFFVILFFLSSEYVFGLEPCELCYWDRLVWYVMLFLSLFGFLGIFDNFILWILGLLNILLGLLVTLYHVGVEFGLWRGLESCSSFLPEGLGEGEILDFLLNRGVVVSCEEVVWDFLGISMAGYGVLGLIFIFLYYVIYGLLEFRFFRRV